MWSTAISIDKKYKTEFDYIIGEIKKSRYSSYAVEESRFRYFVRIVGEEKYLSIAARDIMKIMTDVVLIYFKARYLKDRLVKNGGNVGDAMAILISALIYFDVGIESDILSEIIPPSARIHKFPNISRGNIDDITTQTPEFKNTVHGNVNDMTKTLVMTEEYSIDGLFLFRMGELVGNWDELCRFSVGLLSMNPTDSDILNLTSFLIEASDGKKNKIFISGGEEILIYNATTKEKIYVHDVFSDEKQNLTNAVIGCYPEEIYIKNNLSGSIVDNLKRIAKIRTEDVFDAADSL
jgi:hypothetical protein